MIETTEQLHDYLESRLGMLVENTEIVCEGMDDRTRIGTVAGVLVRVGVELAVRHGAPRDAVERSTREHIEKAYAAS